MPCFEHFSAHVQPGRRLCLSQNSLPETPSDWRQVCYTCYQPRALATDADLAVKREGWYDWRVSTHWPAFNVNLFPAGPGMLLVAAAVSRYSLALQNSSWLHSSASAQAAADIASLLLASFCCCCHSLDQHACCCTADWQCAHAEYYQTNSGEKGGARHITHRDRGAEEDTLARQLAGVQPYPADSVWRDRPLLELSLEELQQQGARI